MLQRGNERRLDQHHSEGQVGRGAPTEDAPKLQTYHCKHSQPVKDLSAKNILEKRKGRKERQT